MATEPHEHVPPSANMDTSKGTFFASIFRAADADDLRRMRSKLYLTDGNAARNLSAFCVLLFLAAVIATAGVVADSTATVIGAMIVAPLMTPILGTALAMVLANRRQIVHNLLLVISGSIVVICIGYLLGMMDPVDVVAATNSQVASRISPRMIDLVAALATGFVGAFAVTRSDVSDALPGVAIAISLVPPLAVVGLTAESGAIDESLGALLLFGTNVAAIIFTGLIFFLVSRLRQTALDARMQIGKLSVRSMTYVVVALILLAIPLSVGSAKVIQEQMTINKAQPVVSAWADEQGSDISSVAYRSGTLEVVIVGESIERTQALRNTLDQAGLEDVPVDVTLIQGKTEHLELTPSA
ncbi:DUF389 domain-containing protein [Glutamicibacter sp.]|uniref:DUF389 domain-containing protein n=1 Tax=Glutamicibacter sp. TaxID=1931995 RepID=UPI0028BF4175|nr:DUF389 domain-containing protein [Glutamicibacter sp.]